jgi:hypothetical protein
MWWKIVNFFIEEHHPEHIVFGQEYRIRKTIRTGNVALLISIITLVIVLLWII